LFRWVAGGNGGGEAANRRWKDGPWWCLRFLGQARFSPAGVRRLAQVWKKSAGGPISGISQGRGVGGGGGGGGGGRSGGGGPGPRLGLRAAKSEWWGSPGSAGLRGNLRNGAVARFFFANTEWPNLSFPRSLQKQQRGGRRSRVTRRLGRGHLGGGDGGKPTTFLVKGAKKGQAGVEEKLAICCKSGR